MTAFEGKTAVITGAASGIGLAISRQLIEQGGTVFGSDLNKERLDQLEQELGSAFIGVPSDAGKVDDIKALFEQVASKVGQLDLLVNNAGIGAAHTPETLDEATYDKVMAVLLKGPVFHLKYAATLLRKSGDGNVVNISSGSSRMSMPVYCPYGLAKAAMEKLTEDGVIQVPGVRHNCVLPGFIDTPILEAGYGDGEELAQMKLDAAAVTPVSRIGQPEDIANMVLFLASEKASFVNGACILVDGGMSRVNKFN